MRGPLCSKASVSYGGQWAPWDSCLGGSHLLWGSSLLSTHLGDPCRTLCTARSRLSHALGREGSIPMAPGETLYKGAGMGPIGIVQGTVKWDRAERGAAGRLRGRGPADHHVPWVRVDAWSRGLPKSHSQLRGQAAPTGARFRWGALPSGSDGNGSAAHTGHGGPGCPRANLQAWHPMGFGCTSGEWSQGGLA